MKIMSATVTYNPSIEQLSKQISVLAAQVEQMLIVDNDSNNIKQIRNLIEKYDNMKLIENPYNEGVARAINQGITQAQKANFDAIVLFDQDSLPSENYVNTLLKVLCDHPDRVRVAALGGQQIDGFTGRPVPFVQFGIMANKKHIRQIEASESVSTDFLITSGSLIPLNIIDEIGFMEEGLFIDNVDLEWCFRASSAGYILLGCFSVTFQHWLGDETRCVFSHLKVKTHNPLRVYYSTRNRFVLYKRPYVPLAWKIRDVLRFLIKSTYLVVFMPERKLYIKALLDGLKDAAGYA